MEAAWEILLHDKKRASGSMNYILLEKIGMGVIRSIPLEELHTLLKQL
jgi:3-dehydroquinate synthase